MSRNHHSVFQDVTVVKDTFGRSNQSSNMDIGWLTTQMEVRLSFLKNPIRWWKKRHQTQRYAMKVKATDPKVETFDNWYNIPQLR